MSVTHLKRVSQQILMSVLRSCIMPLYEYKCDTCQKVFEEMQKFSDEPLKDCPTCKNPVQKLISMTSFALKGSGWYTTDYKKSSAGSAAPASPASTSTPAAASTPAKPTTPEKK